LHPLKTKIRSVFIDQMFEVQGSWFMVQVFREDLKAGSPEPGTRNPEPGT
jgi:hypothetical protein